MLGRILAFLEWAKKVIGGLTTLAAFAAWLLGRIAPGATPTSRWSYVVFLFQVYSPELITSAVLLFLILFTRLPRLVRRYIWTYVLWVRYRLTRGSEPVQTVAILIVVLNLSLLSMVAFQSVLLAKKRYGLGRVLAPELYVNHVLAAAADLEARGDLKSAVAKYEIVSHWVPSPAVAKAAERRAEAIQAQLAFSDKMYGLYLSQVGPGGVTRFGWLALLEAARYDYTNPIYINSLVTEYKTLTGKIQVGVPKYRGECTGRPGRLASVGLPVDPLVLQLDAEGGCAALGKQFSKDPSEYFKRYLALDSAKAVVKEVISRNPRYRRTSFNK